MSKLLRFSTRGMKNLEKEITIDFCPLTFARGRDKVNKVKSLYGYNAIGKSAILASFALYMALIDDPSFLSRQDNVSFLDKVLNRKDPTFSFSILMEGGKRMLRHRIILKKGNEGYFIEEEGFSLPIGRTMNEAYEDIFLQQEASLKSPLVSLLGQEARRKRGIDPHCPLDKEEEEALLFISSLDEVAILMDEEEFGPIAIREPIVENSPFILNKGRLREDELPQYKERLSQLKETIRIFIPELEELKLNLLPLGDGYFKPELEWQSYKRDYSLPLEEESSSIRRLVTLSPYLMHAAMNGIVIIDDFDKHMNSMYFPCLVGFFTTNGHGELFFSAQNVEAMEVLKKYPRSVCFIGAHNRFQTWVKKGNRSPRREYLLGNLESNPRDIEDFAFILPFQPELDP